MVEKHSNNQLSGELTEQESKKKRQYDRTAQRMTMFFNKPSGKKSTLDFWENLMDELYDVYRIDWLSDEEIKKLLTIPNLIRDFFGNNVALELQQLKVEWNSKEFFNLIKREFLEFNWDFKWIDLMEVFEQLNVNFVQSDIKEMSFIEKIKIILKKSNELINENINHISNEIKFILNIEQYKKFYDIKIKCIIISYYFHKNRDEMFSSKDIANLIDEYLNDNSYFEKDLNYQKMKLRHIASKYN